MISLLVFKEQVKKLYIQYEVYILPFLKFLFAMVALLLIDSKLGYMERIGSFAVILAIALMCSFMPKNFIMLVSAIYVLAHLYAVSMEGALVSAAVFLLLFLIYLRFSPKDAIVVLLLPLCFFIKIPYIIPLVMGLISSPISVISVSCGVIIYFLLESITHILEIETLATEDSVLRIKSILDGIILNKEMLIIIIAFSLTILIVDFIKKMSIDHAWKIAIITGATINILVIFIGDLIFDTNISIVGILTGMAVSVLIAILFQLLFFHLDYSRTERVRFEDDEYYYFVKAVPKITMAKSEKVVKRINTTRNGTRR